MYQIARSGVPNPVTYIFTRSRNQRLCQIITHPATPLYLTGLKFSTVYFGVQLELHKLPIPIIYHFHEISIWHHALHAFMVLVALLSACSPRLSITSNNPPGVKLYPPCLRPLATHHHLPGRTCSLYNTHGSNTHQISFCCHIVVDGSNNDDEGAALGQRRHAARQQPHAVRRQLHTAWRMLCNDGDNDATFG